MNLYIHIKFAEAREADNAPELFQKMKIQGMLSLVHARGLEIVRAVSRDSVKWWGSRRHSWSFLIWILKELLTFNYRTSNVDTKN